MRYTLHTSDGPLSLLEMGEAYKQHTRHLLRGYLMVVDGLFSEVPLPLPSSEDLESQNSRLQIALELNQRAQQGAQFDRRQAELALAIGVKVEQRPACLIQPLETQHTEARRHR